MGFAKPNKNTGNTGTKYVIRNPYIGKFTTTQGGQRQEIRIPNPIQIHTENLRQAQIREQQQKQTTKQAQNIQQLAQTAKQNQKRIQQLQQQKQQNDQTLQTSQNPQQLKNLTKQNWKIQRELIPKQKENYNLAQIIQKKAEYKLTSNNIIELTQQINDIETNKAINTYKQIYGTNPEFTFSKENNILYTEFQQPTLQPLTPIQKLERKFEPIKKEYLTTQQQTTPEKTTTEKIKELQKKGYITTAGNWTWKALQKLEKIGNTIKKPTKLLAKDTLKYMIEPKNRKTTKNIIQTITKYKTENKYPKTEYEKQEGKYVYPKIYETEGETIILPTETTESLKRKEKHHKTQKERNIKLKQDLTKPIKREIEFTTPIYEGTKEFITPLAKGTAKLPKAIIQLEIRKPIIQQELNNFLTEGIPRAQKNSKTPEELKQNIQYEKQQTIKAIKQITQNTSDEETKQAGIFIATIPLYEFKIIRGTTGAIITTEATPEIIQTIKEYETNRNPKGAGNIAKSVMKTALGIELIQSANPFSKRAKIETARKELNKDRTEDITGNIKYRDKKTTIKNDYRQQTITNMNTDLTKKVRGLKPIRVTRYETTYPTKPKLTAKSKNLTQTKDPYTTVITTDETGIRITNTIKKDPRTKVYTNIKPNGETTTQIYHKGKLINETKYETQNYTKWLEQHRGQRQEFNIAADDKEIDKIYTLNYNLWNKLGNKKYQNLFQEEHMTPQEIRYIEEMIKKHDSLTEWAAKETNQQMYQETADKNYQTQVRTRITNKAQAEMTKKAKEIVSKKTIQPTQTILKSEIIEGIKQRGTQQTNQPKTIIKIVNPEEIEQQHPNVIEYMINKQKNKPPEIEKRELRLGKAISKQTITPETEVTFKGKEQPTQKINLKKLQKAREKTHEGKWQPNKPKETPWQKHVRKSWEKKENKFFKNTEMTPEEIKELNARETQIKENIAKETNTNQQLILEQKKQQQNTHLIQLNKEIEQQVQKELQQIIPKEIQIGKYLQENKFKIEQLIRTKTKQAIEQKNVTKLTEKQKSEIKQIEKQITKQQQKMIQQQIQKQIQTQIQKQIQTQQQIQKQIQTQITPQITPIIPIPPLPPQTPKISTKPKTEQPYNSYETIIIETKTQTPTHLGYYETKQEAEAAGMIYTDETPQTQFQIQKTIVDSSKLSKQNLNNTPKHKFRQLRNTYWERPQYRRDRTTEIRNNGKFNWAKMLHAY